MKHPPTHNRSLLHLFPVLLIGTALLLPSCSLIGYPIAIFEGDTKEKEVTARYTDLAGKTFAVMVLADSRIRHRFPDAQQNVSTALTGAITRYVQDTTATAPREVMQYQQDHPHWSTLPPSRLLKTFGVERLIVVDLAQYRTQEPGNAHLWKGVIDAAVAVYQAEDADPDNKAFEEPIHAEFPPGRVLGVTDGDHQTMQLGALKAFTLRAAGLFYNHQE